MARRTRLGPMPAVHAFFATLQQGSIAAILIGWPLLTSAVVQGSVSFVALAAIFELLVLISLGVSIATLIRTRRSQAGVAGRTRVVAATLIHSLALLVLQVPLIVLVVGAVQAVASGFSFTFGLDEARLALSDTAHQTLTISGIAAGAVLVTDLAFRISLWFLLPRRWRVGFWILVDGVLVGAFAYVTWKFPLQPTSDDLAALQEPIIRLSITALFAMRLFARFVPVFMASIERIGFLSLIAGRHLKAKKSGFLATISSLSIGAVAVSTCMLVGVLSVMGGFRNDLKEKILGNHAHVLVDKDERDTFEGWSPVLDAVRGAEGVIAATPYVSGEVMLTSASNRAGAVLRGVEPTSLAEVTRIERYLENGRGRLLYLREPERLLDLPPDERRSILPLDIEIEDEDDEGSGIVRDADEAIDDANEEPEEPEPENPSEDPLADYLREPDVDRQGREVLPGIVLGKELARTLRVFLGDDVDVVSPMGDLGPAGPMPKARRFRVAGIFYSGMYEYDMKLVYVLLPRAQRFLNTGDAISGIEINVADVERAPEVASSVTTALTEIDRAELRVRDWQETNQGLFGALALEKLAMFITLGIAILIAGFCVFGTLTLMVQEKGREVGILFAMGTTPRAIVSIFMLEGLLIGLYGATIGLGLGYLVTFAFQHFGIRLNPEVYYIDRLPVHVDPAEFALVGVVALGMCIVATVFPAYLASRTQPVEAIRYQ
ncbi:MAG: ABC transporter permease [Myxococcota bacterium]